MKNREYTLEECKAECARYDGRMEFFANNFNMYQYVKKKGWMDDVCTRKDSSHPHRGYTQRQPLKWDKESVFEEARRCATSKVFRAKAIGAYQSACRNEWIDEINETIFKKRKYKNEKQHKRRKRTIEECKAVAEKYKTCKEFREKDNAVYSYCCAKRWLREVCEHLQQRGRIWDKESVMKEAQKYDRKLDFFNNSQRAYYAAYRLGILKDVMKHMEGRKTTIWDEDKIIDEAKKYTSFKDFITNSRNAYNALRRKRYLYDKVFDVIKENKKRETLSAKRLEKE